MACFSVVATRRAAPRNSLRSWSNPGLPTEPLPLLGAGEEGVPQACGLANPFPPENLVPFPTRAGLSKPNLEGRRSGPPRRRRAGGFLNRVQGALIPPRVQCPSLADSTGTNCGVLRNPLREGTPTKLAGEPL
jgi:hypothetical protein